jgi:hypothetical protein
LKGELFIIIAALRLDVAKPLAAGRACRAITPDRTVVLDDEAISGRNSAADGLDIVMWNGVAMGERSFVKRRWRG